MLRLAIVCLVSISTSACLITIFLLIGTRPPAAEPISNTDHTPVNLPNVQLFDEINARNEMIRTFVSNDLEVAVWQNGMRHRLKGQLYYGKPNQFRLVLTSVFGKELDLGSNEEVFWYWSRRDPRPGLYYAKHNDYCKTRLKTPFNPLYLRSTLGFEPLATNESKCLENEAEFVLCRPQLDATNREVLFCVSVNKELNQVKGFLITDRDQNPLAACEITAPSGIPEKILYTWFEEERTMQITLGESRLNAPLPANLWQLPSYKPTINMAEE